MYVPIVNGKAKPLNMFTAAEARQCLSRRRVVFAGDSYQMQFFVGLAGRGSLSAA